MTRQDWEDYVELAGVKCDLCHKQIAAPFIGPLTDADGIVHYTHRDCFENEMAEVEYNNGQAERDYLEAATDANLERHYL